jgi:hypothetical protein
MYYVETGNKITNVHISTVERTERMIVLCRKDGLGGGGGMASNRSWIFMAFGGFNEIFARTNIGLQGFRSLLKNF